ncbi:MAG TPA: SRPBCC domain-containing protein [Puia sp.]
MTTKDFITTFLVEQTPNEVFEAIKNARGWWSENIEGNTENLNDVFFYSVKDQHHCTVKLIEVVANQKMEWLVLDNYFHFTADQTEWKDTRISFEITKQDGKTQVHFTHIGLVPGFECYDLCFKAWIFYITNSLKDLITTGKGQPNAKEELQKH